MTEQTIAVAQMEAAGLAEPFQEFLQAKAVYEEKAKSLRNAFSVFCGGKGLPEGANLVSVSQKEVVVQVPKQPKQKPAPVNPAARKNR